jgi:putative NIF3 family GTP cyclohydrolase 1 type 2
MKLAEFLDYFEKSLNIPRLQSRAINNEVCVYLQNDSERVYYGDPEREVKKIAFMVQPQKNLCLQAMHSGYDTLVSHHRWQPKNARSPLLTNLDGRLKDYGINMLSYHLYWDIAESGLASCIMKTVFDIPFHESMDLTYKEFTIPDLARWANVSLSFERLRAMLDKHYIRTERYLGHLDWIYDRVVVIPGGGLENGILESLATRMEYDNSEKIVVISSGSGQESGESYLNFFLNHERNFSILDANHYDLEAVGVAEWAQKLGEGLQGLKCDMLYADNYINYSI